MHAYVASKNMQSKESNTWSWGKDLNVHGIVMLSYLLLPQLMNASRVKFQKHWPGMGMISNHALWIGPYQIHSRSGLCCSSFHLAVTIFPPTFDWWKGPTHSLLLFSGKAKTAVLNMTLFLPPHWSAASSRPPSAISSREAKIAQGGKNLQYVKADPINQVCWKMLISML